MAQFVATILVATVIGLGAGSLVLICFNAYDDWRDRSSDEDFPL